jgi:hypothetical protein
MYSITVNINDKPHSKRIPQSWSDVQWCDYVTALQAEGELTEVLEALTGIPKRVLEAMSETDINFIEAQCSFFWIDEMSKECLPVDFVQTQIENDTWQKLIDCEQEFKRVADSDLPQIAAAQFIIKTYTSIDIQGLKVPEALAYWDFFLSNSIIGKSDGLTSTKQQQTKTKLRQELKSYKRSLGLQRLTHLQKETLRNTTRFLRLKQTLSTPSCSRTKLSQSMLRAYGNTTSLLAKGNND